MPTIREVVISPDEALGVVFGMIKGKKDDHRFVIRSINESSSCFAAGIREEDEVVTAASVMASTFESVRALDEFLNDKRYPFLKLVFFRDVDASDGGFLTPAEEADLKKAIKEAELQRETEILRTEEERLWAEAEASEAARLKAASVHDASWHPGKTVGILLGEEGVLGEGAEKLAGKIHKQAHRLGDGVKGLDQELLDIGGKVNKLKGKLGIKFASGGGHHTNRQEEESNGSTRESTPVSSGTSAEAATRKTETPVGTRQRARAETAPASSVGFKTIGRRGSRPQPNGSSIPCASCDAPWVERGGFLSDGKHSRPCRCCGVSYCPECKFVFMVKSKVVSTALEGEAELSSFLDDDDDHDDGGTGCVRFGGSIREEAPQEESRHTSGGGGGGSKWVGGRKQPAPPPSSSSASSLLATSSGGALGPGAGVGVNEDARAFRHRHRGTTCTDGTEATPPPPSSSSKHDHTSPWVCRACAQDMGFVVNGPCVVCEAPWVDRSSFLGKHSMHSRECLTCLKSFCHSCKNLHMVKEKASSSVLRRMSFSRGRSGSGSSFSTVGSVGSTASFTGSVDAVGHSRRPFHRYECLDCRADTAQYQPHRSFNQMSMINSSSSSSSSSHQGLNIAHNGNNFATTLKSARRTTKPLGGASSGSGGVVKETPRTLAPSASLPLQPKWIGATGPPPPPLPSPGLAVPQEYKSSILRVGMKVEWAKADEDIPAGSVGVVLPQPPQPKSAVERGPTATAAPRVGLAAVVAVVNGGSGRVHVRFPLGTFDLAHSQLKPASAVSVAKANKLFLAEALRAANQAANLQGRAGDDDTAATTTATMTMTTKTETKRQEQNTYTTLPSTPTASSISPPPQSTSSSSLRSESLLANTPQNPIEPSPGSEHHQTRREVMLDVSSGIRLGLDLSQDLVITRVVPGSAADIAGLQPGWALLAVGGESVKTLTEAQRKLIAFLAKAAANKKKGGDGGSGGGCAVLIDTAGITGT